MVKTDSHQQDHLVDPQEDEDQGIFFKLIEKVGSNGNYQFTLFITLASISLIAGAVLLMTPFLFYQEKYICQEGRLYSQCLDVICLEDPDDRAKYIPDDPYIVSFANKFGDYRCPQEQSKLDLIKTIFYSGQLIGFFLSSLIGDLVRAKILLLSGLITTLVGIAVLAFSDNMWVTIAGMLLFATGPTISFNLTYIFVTEMVEQKRRQKYKVILASMFSVGALYDVLWFYVIPNFRTVSLIFFGIPVIILTALFIIFFKDTPISLITKNPPEKAHKNLLYIANFNGIANPNLTLEDIRQTQRKYQRAFMRKTTMQVKKFSIIDLFRYKSLRVMTILLIILDCVFYLQYLAPTLMLDQFDFNIFINGGAIESAQIFVGFIGYFTIGKVPRRIYGVVSFGIIAACSIALIFIWDQDNTENTELSSNIIVLIFIFFIELTVSNAFNFYAVYLNELYPTQIRIVGIGFIKVFGSITAMVSSQIINACIYSGFKIMLLFALLAIISMLIYYLLPETKGKRPPEMIEELMYNTTESPYQKIKASV